MHCLGGQCHEGGRAVHASLAFIRPGLVPGSTGRESAQLTRELNCDKTQRPTSTFSNGQELPGNLWGVGLAQEGHIGGRSLVGAEHVPIRGNITGLPMSTWEPDKEPIPKCHGQAKNGRFRITVYYWCWASALVGHRGMSASSGIRQSGF